MPRALTIVMYHYVRDLRRSRYPAIRGRDLQEFREQLAFFAREYQIVRMEEVLAAVASGEALPPRALLLTFDDGYIDHYACVFPLLDAYGVQGSFFPAPVAVAEGRVLDANKIQFTLAAAPQPDSLAGLVLERVDAFRARHTLPAREELVERFGAANRYDSPPVTLVKRLLQRGLPEDVRRPILDELFAQIVTSDESAFANELYATPDQLRCMLGAGMFLGSHGYSHDWLDALPADRQREDLAKALEFLRSLGARAEDWVLAYPYGGHDGRVMATARELGCRLALTVTVGVADLDRDDRLALPRMDTNDFPTAGSPANPPGGAAPA